jgi:hypothetical protein
MARRLGRGDDRVTTEKQWQDTRTLVPRLGLALRDDPDAQAPNRWLDQKRYRAATKQMCNRNVHAGFDGDPLLAVQHVRRTITDLRAEAPR